MLDLKVKKHRNNLVNSLHLVDMNLTYEDRKKKAKENKFVKTMKKRIEMLREEKMIEAEEL